MLESPEVWTDIPLLEEEAIITEELAPELAVAPELILPILAVEAIIFGIEQAFEAPQQHTAQVDNTRYNDSDQFLNGVPIVDNNQPARASGFIGIFIWKRTLFATPRFTLVGFI